MRSQSRSSARPASAWLRLAAHAWKARFSRSAASRVSAYGSFVSRLHASAWRLSGSLSRMFRSQWFQHRCSFASEKTAVSAPQIPRCPSPITSLGAASPRRLRSCRIPAQLFVDSG